MEICILQKPLAVAARRVCQHGGRPAAFDGRAHRAERGAGAAAQRRRDRHPRLSHEHIPGGHAASRGAHHSSTSGCPFGSSVLREADRRPHRAALGSRRVGLAQLHPVLPARFRPFRRTDAFGPRMRRVLEVGDGHGSARWRARIHAHRLRRARAARRPTLHQALPLLWRASLRLLRRGRQPSRHGRAALLPGRGARALVATIARDGRRDISAPALQRSGRALAHGDVNLRPRVRGAHG